MKRCGRERIHELWTVLVFDSRSFFGFGFVDVLSFLVPVSIHESCTDHDRSHELGAFHEKIEIFVHSSFHVSEFDLNPSIDLGGVGARTRVRGYVLSESTKHGVGHLHGFEIRESRQIVRPVTKSVRHANVFHVHS